MSCVQRQGVRQEGEQLDYSHLPCFRLAPVTRQDVMPGSSFFLWPERKTITAPFRLIVAGYQISRGVVQLATGFLVIGLLRICNNYHKHATARLPGFIPATGSLFFLYTRLLCAAAGAAAAQAAAEKREPKHIYIYKSRSP